MKYAITLNLLCLSLWGTAFAATPAPSSDPAAIARVHNLLEKVGGRERWAAARTFYVKEHVFLKSGEVGTVEVWRDFGSLTRRLVVHSPSLQHEEVLGESAGWQLRNGALTTFDATRLAEERQGLRQEPYATTHAREAVDDALSLATYPTHVYVAKGHGKLDVDSWQFDLVVLGAADTDSSARSAILELRSGTQRVKSIRLDRGALAALAGTRYRILPDSPPWSMRRRWKIPEVVSYRLRFSEPTKLAIDATDIKLELTAAGSDKPLSLSTTVPISRYQQKTRLIFPFRGKGIITQGRFFEGGHSERDTQFAIDAVALSETYAPLTSPQEKNESMVGWTREVIAPAAGRVAFARSDVPNNTKWGDPLPPAFFESLADPGTLIGGNSIVIDHGNGEYSVLMHLQAGSARVRVGDRVSQGDVLGLIGNSGDSYAPHLHYCLQDGPQPFNANSLPFGFANVQDSELSRGSYFEAK